MLPEPLFGFLCQAYQEAAKWCGNPVYLHDARFYFYLKFQTKSPIRLKTNQADLVCYGTNYSYPRPECCERAESASRRAQVRQELITTRSRLEGCRFLTTVVRHPVLHRKALGAVIGFCAVAALGGHYPSPPVSCNHIAYLPLLGPAPLRFQVVRMGVPPKLPPLNPPPESPVPANSTNAPVSELNKPAPFPAKTDEPAKVIDVSSPAPDTSIPDWLRPGSEPAPVAAPINTQSIVGFLKAIPTNGPSAGVIAPFVIPPTPPSAAPSSRAVYESK